MNWKKEAREIQVKFWRYNDTKLQRMNDISKIVWFIKVKNHIAYLTDDGGMTDDLFDAKPYYTKSELASDFNKYCNDNDYEIVNGSITRKYEIFRF